MAVDEFAEAMSIFYPGEDIRASIGRALVNEIFAARRDGFRPTITAASIGPVQCSTAQSRQWSVRTDGHFTGDHGVLIVIGEFKNRSTGNSGQPEVDACLESLPNVAGWRVPAVGISIVGMS